MLVRSRSMRWGLVRSPFRRAIVLSVPLVGLLAMTGLWTGSWSDTPKQGPGVTPAGKFVARIDGLPADIEGMASMPRRTPSIVNRGASPTRSAVLIDDVAWPRVHDRIAAVPTPPFRRARAPHDAKRAATMGAVAVDRESPLRSFGGRPVPPRQVPSAEAHDGGIWSATQSTVLRLASLGGGVMAHVLP